MDNRVLLYKKSPKGMTLEENEKGYTIHIHFLDWNYFPLWFILMGLGLPFIVLSIIRGEALYLLPAGFFLYFAYLIGPFVLLKLKIEVDETCMKIYSFWDIVFKRASYEIDLSKVSSIRMVSARTGGSNGTGTTWGQSGTSFLDFMNEENKIIDRISIFKKEYNIFISQFLKEYIKNIN